MENLPDETLMAYADGALDAHERARVEAILAADAAQRQRLEPFVLTRHALPSLFSEALTSGVPDRLVATVMNAPVGTRPASYVRAAKREPLLARICSAISPGSPAWQGGFALAACLAAIAGTGFVAGHVLAPPADVASAIAFMDDEAIAAGPLQTALNSTPSDSVLEHGLVRVRPAITFRDTAGRFCRQYSMLRAGHDEVAGFACRRSDGRWSLAFHAPVAQPGTTSRATPPHDGAASQDFTPAGDSQNPALQDVIDKAVSGNPLTKDEEQRLIQQSWPRTAPLDQRPH